MINRLQAGIYRLPEMKDGICPPVHFSHSDPDCCRMPMKYLIRPMESRDIPEVFSIDKASAALYWPERSYHFEVEQNEASRPLIAVDENRQILGFIVFWLIIDEAHLANFAVRESVRCRGIGKALLYSGLRVCYEGGARVSFLEVRSGNDPAIHLYQGAGYHTESIRKQYYQDNHEDALLMNLDPEEYEALMHRIGKAYTDIRLPDDGN